jgi:hypothetical protein
MIALRLYQDGDYESIVDGVEPFINQGDFSVIKDSGVYLTMTHDDKVICCGGVVVKGDDEGVVWVKLSKSFCKKPIVFYRTMRHGLDIIIESLGFSKITTKVQEGFEQGERLVRHLGFKKTNQIEPILCVTYRIYEL